MTKASAKANPWNLVRAQRRTYVDAVSGKRRWRDILLLEGVPILASAGSLLVGVKLGSAVCVGLLTVAGLLSALFFGVMLQVSDRAIAWSDAVPEPSPATSSHATYLEELAANAGYASLVSITTALVYVVASVSAGKLLLWSSAIGIGLGIHLVLILFMVMKRVFALTQERLIRARTGADIARPRKRAS